MNKTETILLPSETKVAKKKKQWIGYLAGRKVCTSPDKTEVERFLCEIHKASPTLWPVE
jgi:hypothetical protein